jgi:putative PIN family toxin of toxin-antitoxin system
MQPLVLDTNVVLDLFVFGDEAAGPLREGLARGQLRWLATAAMRDELSRVLAYPKLAARLAAAERAAEAVLADFDRHACIVDAAAPAPLVCGDPDDQMFVDLAVAHASLLISKDAEVLALRKRLATLQDEAAARWPDRSGYEATIAK